MAVKIEKWLVAKKKHRLSDKHVQMARELSLNPDKLGKIDNHKQEVWKAPLPQFIEEIYFKRFKKEMPDEVKPLEQIIKERKIKDEKAKKDKLKRRKEMEQKKFVAVFDGENILESIITLGENLISELSEADILSSCESKTNLNGKTFRLVHSDTKISASNVGTYTLEEFDMPKKI